MVGGETSADRWLVIAEEAFVPADSGGRAESSAMLHALAEGDVDLHVLVPGLDADDLARHRAALPGAVVDPLPRGQGLRPHLSPAPYVLASRPAPRGFARTLRAVHARRPFTAVVALTFRTIHLGERAAAALDLPLVVRPHNLESGYFADLARSTRGPRAMAYRLEAAKLRAVEARVHRSTRVALFADISETDARRRRAGTTIPVRHEPPFLHAPRVPSGLPSPAGGRPRLVFVGSMDNANNRAAVAWFVQRCWPELRGVADLDVVGRRFPDRLAADLVAAGVRVVADAPSIEPLLHGASIFVNPMLHGSGVNIKVIEAMAAGLPVVSTSVGARGMPWSHGEHLLVVDSPAAFIDSVRSLIADPAGRSALAASGRSFVLDGLGPTRRVADLRAAVARHGSRHHQHRGATT